MCALIKLFHVTTLEQALKIAHTNFVDPNGGKCVGAGVWFADKPLWGDAMFCGEHGPFAALAVEFTLDEIEDYKEPMPEGSGHREWQIPYDVVNQHFVDRTVIPKPCEQVSMSNASRAFSEILGEWVNARCDEMGAATAAKKQEAKQRMHDAFHQLVQFPSADLSSEELEWLKYFEDWTLQP